MQPLPAAGHAPPPPLHVAIIMDGNRRWARSRGMPPIYGHRRGAEAIRRSLEACRDLGVRYLTLYAFSSENWRRSPGEVGELMDLLRYYLRREVDKLAENGVQLRFIGDHAPLPADIRAMVEEAEARTSANRALTLIIALNYGARQEILRVARRLAGEAVADRLEPAEIDEVAFASRLDTADLPDPDLLIRTSGEQRLSNFLLWQLAYTELVFLPISWPEFDKGHLAEAIAEFHRRERRYGASGG